MEGGQFGHTGREIGALGPSRENKGRTMGDGPTGRGTRDSHESRRRAGEGHLSPYVRGRTGGWTRTGSLHPSIHPPILQLEVNGSTHCSVEWKRGARFTRIRTTTSLVSFPSLHKQ